MNDIILNFLSLNQHKHLQNSRGYKAWYFYIYIRYRMYHDTNHGFQKNILGIPMAPRFKYTIHPTRFTGLPPWLKVPLEWRCHRAMWCRSAERWSGNRVIFFGHPAAAIGTLRKGIFLREHASKSKSLTLTFHEPLSDTFWNWKPKRSLYSNVK